MQDQTKSPEDPKIIKASPTKDLFITMLVRDLTLRDAIGDLVDNSVDGAKTLKPDKKYEGLIINITANETHFIIEDNCGGISVPIARNYAFRFGRPKDSPPTPGSVGQFGIGMKRSLFKLGNKFSIDSISDNSDFTMDVNVREWEKSDKWDFRFETLNEDVKHQVEERGTKIKVTDLNVDVKNVFSRSQFIADLIREIELEHMYSVNSGLKISINNTLLKSRELFLRNDKEIKTGFWEKKFDDGMSVRIYAGAGDPVNEDGGWYIFCNDRLIVGPEQTELSGWTGGRSEGGPSYHQQFNRFRGYVFFEAADSSILPWNTTKNGMDRESARFKLVRLQMIEMMKPVISFLNKMKSEREGDPSNPRPLEKIINSSALTPISKITESELPSKFEFPNIPAVPKKAPKDGRISYDKPMVKIMEVMESTGSTTYKEVGEKTFDYYYQMEIGE